MISAVSSSPKRITRGEAVDTNIECIINGVKGDAKVEWIDPEGNKIPEEGDANYETESGSRNAEGIQTATLTLKGAFASKISSAQIYKCSVTSGYFPGSPTYEFTVPLLFPISEFYAENLP